MSDYPVFLTRGSCWAMKSEFRKLGLTKSTPTRAAKPRAIASRHFAPVLIRMDDPKFQNPGGELVAVEYRGRPPLMTGW